MTTNNELQKLLSETSVRRSVTRALLHVFRAIENENENCELWQDLWRPAFADISKKVAKSENFTTFCESFSNFSESLGDEQECENLDILARCFQKTDIFSVMDFYGIPEVAFFHRLDDVTRKAFTDVVDKKIKKYSDDGELPKDSPIAVFASGSSSKAGCPSKVDRFALASALTLPSGILNAYVKNELT